MLRRILRWFSLSIFILALLPAAAFAWSLWRADVVPKQSILHVVLDGSIDEAPHSGVGQLFGQGAEPTLHQLTQGIRHAAHDARIVGLLLDIRSPHVGVAQLEEIVEAVNDFRDSGKWNLSFLETAGELGHGDGAFALATLADKVVLSPPGEVHLSGLRAETTFYKETLDRAQVQPYTEQRYEYKNYANSFTQNSFTAPHKEALKGVLDDLQETLLHIIANNRDTDVETVRSWVLGAPYAADAALAHKMVDKVAYWDEVETMARTLAGRDEPFEAANHYCTRHHGKKGGVPVALIIASGEISRGESSALPINQSPHIGSDTFAQALRDARDDGVEAVLLRIDSPGGSYIASDVIRREVQLTRDANIPVVVSMGNTAASGGYMIATDADYIVAEPGTVTGSIGVLAAAFSMRQALHHWVGLNFDAYETLPHPGTLGWLDPPSDADRARFGASIDRIYRDFVSKVATGRHKSYDDIHAVAKGRIWSGRQAHANGLVDELGGFTTATQYLRKRLKLAPGERLDMIQYPEAPSKLDAVRDLLAAQGRVAATVSALKAQAVSMGLWPPATGIQARLEPEVGAL